MTEDEDLKPLSLDDPTVDGWLKTRFPAEQFALIAPAPLIAMPIAVERTDELALTEPLPDAVMSAWVRMQENYRRQADQSEASMVALILRQGGSWEDVARILRTPDARAAQERYGELVVRLSTPPHN
jgi:hypothetical protein